MKSAKLSILILGLILVLGSWFGEVDPVFAQVEFIRGDADGDCLVSYSDAAFITGYLYGSGSEPPCMDAGDVNDNGVVDFTDAIYLLNYLFHAGSAPPAPFPTSGTDPTPDDLDCLAECVPIDTEPSLLDSLIAGDTSGIWGETGVVVPIIAVNSQDLFGYQIYLDYNETILEVTAVESTGTATGVTGADFFSYDLNVSEGKVEIACIVNYPGTASIPAGRNILANIIFSVKSNAPLGPTILDLYNLIEVPFKGNLFTFSGEKRFPTLVDGNFTVVEREFTRGDADGDCLVGYYDLAHLTAYLYGGDPELPCMDAGDVDDDGIINIEDVNYLLNYIYKIGPSPPAPFPAAGTDPTPDDLNCLRECIPIDPEPSVTDSLILSDASGSCGETEVIVPIMAVNSQDLFGYQIFLDYDEDILEIIAVETTGTATGVAGADQFSYSLGDEVEIACIVDYSGANSIPADRNVLAKIIFSVKPDAPLGMTDLDLNNVLEVPFRGNLFTYDEEKLYPTLVDGDFTVVPIPSILSVTDVGNDQGRQARIRWTRSCYDAVGSPVTITEYSIWRRIDVDKALGQSVTSGKGRIYPPGDWDFIKTVPARGEEEYNTVCPTLGDSTEDGGMYWSVFFVSAMTVDPLVFYDSDSDSGYSVDNIPPLPIMDMGIDPQSWFTLEWTVPGEYVGEEPISGYLVRYSTFPVGSDPQTWWDNAEACNGDEFFNYVVGGKDSLQVATDVLCHPEVFFAIKGLDDHPNYSDISNIVHYVCGDASGDEEVDVDDVVYLISYLFRNGNPPEPMAEGDVNCDGGVEVGDVVCLINYLFRDGDPPGSQ